MKTILRMTFLFAFAAIAGNLMASGNLNVHIQPITSEKALIAISSLTESDLKITVEDEQGRIVYFKQVTEQTGDYKKVFDFSALEAGRYNLSVESDHLTTERAFEIKDWKIVVGKEKTILEPYFGYNNGILRCSYLNFPKENLTLLFYNDNELLYTKEIGRGFSVTEALNLSKLDKGRYKAILLSGSKEFTYPIAIN